jgi:hypothetical protein
MVVYRSKMFKGGNCKIWKGQHGARYSDTLPDITINTIDRCCGVVRQFAGVSLCLLLSPARVARLS